MEKGQATAKAGAELIEAKKDERIGAFNRLSEQLVAPLLTQEW